MSKEIWIDFHKFYQISDLGRVRSKDRTYTSNTPDKGKIRKGKILKLNDRVGQRYISINLYLYGEKKTLSIHRLVAESFIPNVGNKSQVNHINGDKKDNRSINLEWNTPSENSLHAYRLKLNKSVGERHPKTSLLENEVRAIKLLQGIKTLDEMACFFDVGKSTISSIYLDKTWRYLDD